MELRIGVTLAVAWIAATGCDRKPATSVPPPVPKVVSDRPTTQELIDTPFKALSLLPADIPATILVPKGWTLTAADTPGRMRIEGFTPTDVAELGFDALVTKTELQKQDLIESARRTLAADPLTASIPATRESNGALVIESIDTSIPKPSTRPASTGPADAAGPVEPAVQWSVMLCIPNRDRFAVYEIRTIGMTRTQLKADRDFLQKVMGSLTYVPPGDDHP